MIRTVLRVLAALVAVGALAGATAAQWSRVGSTWDRLSLWTLAVGALATVVATLCSMLAWRAILADLGSPLPYPAAGGVFFLGQLGKYVPGSVWPVVAQMELGRAHGVPRRRSGVAALLVIVVGLTAAGATAAVTLPFAGALGEHRWVLALPALGLALLHPKVPALAARVLRREPPERTLSWPGLARAMGWSLAQWLAYGAGVWAVARGLPDAPRGLLVLATGAYALAWAAGFLVLVAPAGAGVREGALVLLLAPAYGSGPALGIALVARLLATVGDLVWGLAAFARFGVTVVTRGTGRQDGEPDGRTEQGGPEQPA